MFIPYKTHVSVPLWFYIVECLAGTTGARGNSVCVLNLYNSMQKSINPIARNCRNTFAHAKLIAIKEKLPAMYQNRRSAALLHGLRLYISCGTIPPLVFRKTHLLRRLICLVQTVCGHIVNSLLVMCRSSPTSVIVTCVLPDLTALLSLSVSAASVTPQTAGQ